MLLEPYDASELKLRKPGEVLREIPTSYYSKRYIPLCDNLFTALRLSDSWEQYTGSTEESWEDFEESFANGIRTRMKDSFEIAKAIEEAKIWMQNEFLNTFQLKIVFKPPAKEIKFLKLYGDMVVLHPYCSMSDTIRRLIFHLAIVMSNENSILIFEESETKTFPYYIKYLAELISLDDKNNQYFVSTHNPYFLLSLLEKMKLSQIGVFIIYFQNGQTKFRIMEEKDIAEIMDQGMALDIFFNIKRFLEP